MNKQTLLAVLALLPLPLLVQAAGEGGQSQAQAQAAEATAPPAPSGWSRADGLSSKTPVPGAAGGPAAAAGAPPVAAGSLTADAPLPPPSPLYGQAEEAVSPLTPDEIRQLRGRQSAVNQALAAPQVAVVPRISALTVDLQPGASLPLVRTAINHPSSLTFMDSGGSPWPIGAAPLSGNPDIEAYWVPDTAVMVVSARRPWVSGSITVYLKGLPVPVMLNVTSGEPDTAAKTWTVDSRLDLRVPRRGPNARPLSAPDDRIALHDGTLQAFLDGIPPKGARQLKVTGAVPETTVWQLGDDLFIRSRAELRDEFDSTLSSADGTHLWKLPVTPYASFSVMGRTVALNIALE